MQYNPYTPAASKKIEIEKKIEYLWWIMPENKKYKKLGCLKFLIFCRHLPGFFARLSCRGLAGGMKIFQRYKKSTRIFSFDILPETCRGFYFCLLAGTCRTDEKSRTIICGCFCYWMKIRKNPQSNLFRHFNFLPRWCTVILVLVHHLKLSDPHNRNHKSLAIANRNFEVASFPCRNRSEIAALQVFSESQWFFWVAMAVASDLRFEIAAIRVTKIWNP